MLITALTKISILIFYRRLSHGTYTTSWIWTVRGFIAFVAALAVTFAILLCAGCRPFKAFWLRVNIEWVMNNEYSCFNEGVNFIVFAVINVITDAAVCILPLLVLRRLQMPKRQKWALSALFGIGFFLCFCGIMRLVWLYIVYYTTYDLTWTTNYIFSWTLVETHFSIVCASAPALNVFFRRILQATTHRDPNSNPPSHQRNVYSTIGSGGSAVGGSRPRLNDDGGESGESGIYMADMIAYKAAKAEARRRERASSLFSVSEEEEENGKDEEGRSSSSRRGSSMTVTHEELDADGVARGSDDTLPAVEEEQPRSSRGSTDSILETHHVVVVGGLGK
ncbi:hypothetical protein DIS24_g9394 [Lasiodiplodia hormozganensis]|uniref:Rhodopsin domain-containing protein n=1 Tax=Lasiodiplodia hormozganensis TaxID=869390 RepID=A0AA39XUF4_9PEZI|nr:hypothetical protein DIS24_g9394 [Lasiodiplodia hormozganensis]